MADHESPFRRRHFLLTAAAAAPSFVLAGEGLMAPAWAQSQPDYAPTYFTGKEWDFLKAAAARLIPADDTGPGALEAGVPEFIDRQMDTEYGHGGLWYLEGPYNTNVPPTLGYQYGYNPRELYRIGIQDVEDYCSKSYNKDFAALNETQQDELLAQLEHGKVGLAHIGAAIFFSQLLANTKEGYFADPMYGGNKGMAAWKMIGFPGARADFADWVKRPNKPYPLGPVSILGEKG
jgi:gluconate 2-dehydrogenase gamma chain